MRKGTGGEAERGQAMVLFALAAVGLLVMVGLAIDGGTVFLERRRMQNAADAAALAGAQKLSEIMCDETVTPQGADAAIWDAVERYARDNGVRDPSGTTVAEYVKFDGPHIVAYSPSVYVGNSLDGGDGVPTAATGISVTTAITHTTYFVSLIGIHTTSASAPAVSVTAPLAVTDAVRPFGVPIELVQDLNDGGALSVTFENDGGEVTWEDKTEQHRGWMNLGYVWNADEEPESFPRAVDENAGASELKEWMENGWEVELSADNPWPSSHRGDFIHAKPGANASAVCEAPEWPQVIKVPVYDHVPHCLDITTVRPPCPTQGGGYVYHIVGFATLEITACSQGGKQIDAQLRELRSGLGEVSWSSGYNQGECELKTLTAITLWE